MQGKTMYMKDWIELLDGFLKMSRQEVLANAGKISGELAQRKAKAEYETYSHKVDEELSEVEKHFIESIEHANRKLKEISTEKKKNNGK